MGHLVNLKSFRKKKRDEFYRKHGSKLDIFILRFMNENFPTDFFQIALYYQELQMQNEELLWDYVAFRDLLIDAVEKTFGSALMNELEKQPWFDRLSISKEEVVERCLSIFIIGETRNFGPK